MIDVVVCAKDALATLPACLWALHKQKGIGKIIVVTPASDSITASIAEIYPLVTVIKEPINYCLAWARQLGVKYTTAEYVAFVDADILLGKNHLYFLYLSALLLSTRYPSVAVEGILTKKTIHKNYLSIGARYPEKTVTQDTISDITTFRGYTHNTLFNRKALLSWASHFTHAWEDWLLTQHILTHHGIWARLEVPGTSFNLQDYNQFKRASWAQAGERLAKPELTTKAVLQTIALHILRGMKILLFTRNMRQCLTQWVVAVGRLRGFFAWDKYMALMRV